MRYMQPNSDRERLSAALEDAGYEQAGVYCIVHAFYHELRPKFVIFHSLAAGKSCAWAARG